MTLDKFLAALAKTPRDWSIVYGREIRRGINCCPVTAVEDNHLTCGNVDVAGEALDLNEGTITDIVEASDHIKARPELRARLLEACGLSE